MKELCYLVDWSNGFVGGYTEDFKQQFNTPKQELFDDLKRLHISEIKIISPQELDALRGYHKPNFQEYLAGTRTKEAKEE